MTDPVPASGSNPVPPPVGGVAYFDPKTGKMTTLGLNFFTQFWAAFQGSGGTVDNLLTLTTRVNTLFAMHGDATITTDGAITVESSEGRPFVASAFTDTTIADNITAGTLSPDRIADQSLPQAKITGLSDPVTVSALGAPTAGIRAFVSDSTVAASGNFGAIVAGGGSNKVPVFGDGANWRIG